MCRAAGALPGLRLPAAPVKGRAPAGREGDGKRPGRWLGGPGGACVALPGRGGSARLRSARLGPWLPRPVRCRRALPGPAAPLPPMLCQSRRCPHPTRRYGGPGRAGGLAGSWCPSRGADTRRAVTPASVAESSVQRSAPGAAGGTCSLQEPPGGSGARSSVFYL